MKSQAYFNTSGAVLKSLGTGPGRRIPPDTAVSGDLGQPPAEQGLYMAHLWVGVEGASPTPTLTLWRPAAKLAGTVP